MDTNALFKIGYGLYVLTANENEKDNGCIVNTVMQVTSDPCQIAVCVNKNNYTCGMVQRSKKLNISILCEGAEFDIFKNFGYQSGKDTDKFMNFPNVKRSPNGVLYITKNTNAFSSLERNNGVKSYNGMESTFVKKGRRKKFPPPNYIQTT